MPSQFTPSPGGVFRPDEDHGVSGDWRFTGDLTAGPVVVSRDGSAMIGDLAVSRAGTVRLEGQPLIAPATPLWVAARPRITRIWDAMTSGWTAQTAGGTYTHVAEGLTGAGTALKIVTTSTVSSATARSAVYNPVLDLSTGNLGVWIKVQGLSQLSECWLQVSSDDFATNNLLWVIENFPTTRPFLIDGEWAFVTLALHEAQATGTTDLEAINRARIRLLTPSTAGATVWIDALAQIAAPAATGVCAITFDDSHASQFTTARPIMDVYGFPATAYNIVSLIDEGTGFTLDQAKQLHRLHGWEMAAHALTMDYHQPGLVNTDMTDAQLHENFRGLRRWLIEHGFGSGADHYAYPGGAFDRRVLDIISQYFASARTIASAESNGGPIETYPVADPHRLRICNVFDTTPTATLTAEIDRAVTAKTWLILVFHQIVTTATSSIQYSTANFTTVMAHLFASGLPVRTVGDVLKHGM
jgi:peptidoglycan/xylan/chitin deacetylase (PgdA/CDA1 family)